METYTSGTPGATGNPGDGAQLTDQVKQGAGQALDSAKDAVKNQLHTQKENASHQIGTVADAIRQVGDNLRGQEQAGFISNYTDGAAETVERVSRFLQERDVDEIVGEVEQLARRQPAVFLGGAFALGFLLARFLKSSGRSGSSYSYSGGYGQEYGQSYSGSYNYGQGYSETSGQPFSGVGRDQSLGTATGSYSGSGYASGSAGTPTGGSGTGTYGVGGNYTQGIADSQPAAGTTSGSGMGMGFGTSTGLSADANLGTQGGLTTSNPSLHNADADDIDDTDADFTSSSSTKRSQP